MGKNCKNNKKCVDQFDFFGYTGSVWRNCVKNYVLLRP